MTTQFETDNVIGYLESLTELELAPICEALKQHCAKNKMPHLMNCQDDRIEELESENEELASELREVKEKYQSAIGTIEQIRELL